MMGKGSVLLLPILQLEQLKETSLRETLLSRSKQELYKDNSVLEWGCPSLLCRSWHLFELESENKAKAPKFRYCVDKCSGKRRPCLGPFAITFPDA